MDALEKAVDRTAIRNEITRLRRGWDAAVSETHILRDEIARLRKTLLSVKYGAEYPDELGDEIDAAFTRRKTPVMAVTHDNGTVKQDDLAEFLWNAEYDSDTYPWSRVPIDERTYYTDCARALVAKFDIYPK